MQRNANPKSTTNITSAEVISNLLCIKKDDLYLAIQLIEDSPYNHTVKGGIAEEFRQDLTKLRS